MRDFGVSALVAVAVFLVLTVGLGGGWWYRDTPFPESPPAQEALAHAAEEPSPAGGEREGLHAELAVDRLGIRAPIVWSRSTEEEAFQRDLERGIIHYPGTALPGHVGNAFLAGHSSDYPWKPGNYQRIFGNLRALRVGDEDIVVTYRNQEQTQRFRFRVTETAVVSDTDQRMFAQGGVPELTLVTCWPLGTNWKRLMVKAILVESS